METRTRPEDRPDVIVVGGGRAGLAMGYQLARQQRRFTILEAAVEAAASWRARWDSLTLFTPVRFDNLRGRPFPGDPDTYRVRDQVVDHLCDCARHFELLVELSSRVESVRRRGDGHVVGLEDRHHSRGSALLGWVKEDAAYLAERISRWRRA